MALRICGEEEDRLIAGPDNSAPHSTKQHPNRVGRQRAARPDSAVNPGGR
jgi:hypothetical protein